MAQPIRVFFRLLFAAAVCLSVTANAAGPAASNTDPLVAAMQKELNRAKTDLAKSDPAPYFLSYTVYDQNELQIVASYGALLVSGGGHRRNADVVMRVGTPALDNTHLDNRAS